MKRRQAGMTLVELLIVVVIVGILATIANIGFRRYVGRARTSEAATVLAEMMAKELLYFSEFSMYLPLRATPQPTPVNEDAAAFYPWNPNTEDWDSVRDSKAIPPASWPIGWTQIGLRPKMNSLYCTYLLNTGTSGAGAGPPAGTIGFDLLTANPATQWFYALGSCNMNGVKGFPLDVTTFVLTSESPRLTARNEGK